MEWEKDEAGWMDEGLGRRLMNRMMTFWTRRMMRVLRMRTTRMRTIWMRRMNRMRTMMMRTMRMRMRRGRRTMTKLANII